MAIRTKPEDAAWFTNVRIGDNHPNTDYWDAEPTPEDIRRVGGRRAVLTHSFPHSGPAIDLRTLYDG